jgi:hypothetical protein
MVVGTTHGPPPAAAASSFLAGAGAYMYWWRFCAQVAASASRAIRCFLCDRYFCKLLHHLSSAPSIGRIA